MVVELLDGAMCRHALGGVAPLTAIDVDMENLIETETLEEFEGALLEVREVEFSTLNIGKLDSEAAECAHKGRIHEGAGL